MLELIQPHKVKLVEDKTLSQKNRPVDEKPGVKLTFEGTFPNVLLDDFDPAIRKMAYEPLKAKATQQPLEGVPEVSPTPHMTQAGIKMKSITWSYDFTGYTATIVRGTGSKHSNIPLSDAIIRWTKIKFEEGGTFYGRFTVEAGNIEPAMRGDISTLKSRDCEITLQAPEVRQADLDAEEKARQQLGDAAPPRKPGAAERAAVAKAGKEPAAPPAPAPKRKPTKAEIRAAAEGAFKKPGEGDAPAGGNVVKIEQSQPNTRTARGRDATAAFIKAQQEQQAKAGEKAT